MRLVFLAITLVTIVSADQCVTINRVDGAYTETYGNDMIGVAHHNLTILVEFSNVPSPETTCTIFGQVYPVEASMYHTFVVIAKLGKFMIPIQVDTPGCDSVVVEYSAYGIPGVVGLLPPITTLILAFWTRHIVVSLFVGVVVGVTILHKFNPLFGLLFTVDTVIPDVASHSDYIVIIILCLNLSGMVVIMSKSGGAAGFADFILSRATSTRSGQFTTWLLGICVFFDDYANILIVGTTANLVADRFRISREKLAFLIDATAAPIASLAPISSWVGFEISLIKNELKRLDIDENEYMVFLRTIPMRYYSIFLIIFCVTLIATQRDFGPMLVCERKARNLDDEKEEIPVKEEKEIYKPLPNVPRRWYNAAIPIVGIVIFGFCGMVYDGMTVLSTQKQENYNADSIFSAARPGKVLMWTSFVSLFLPMIMYWCQGIMRPAETVQYYIEGMKELLEAVVILILSWSLGFVISELQLSEYLIAATHGSISKGFLPTGTFLIAALVSLCTGSSWSTMSVLFPIIIPMAWSYDTQMYSEKYELLVQSIASILAGSVFGDHCSPMSDTTILVCLASKCSITDHIRTQTPYTIIVASIAILVGIIPTAMADSYTDYVALPVGALLTILTVLVLGKKVDAIDPPSPQPNTLSRILLERA